MKKRQLFIAQLEAEHSETGIEHNNEFAANFKNAILLSLLKDKKITERQYERCLEIIGHTMKR